MALVVVIVAGALVAVLAAAGEGGSETDRRRPAGTGSRAVFVGDGPATVGGTAPDFALPGLDGGRVSLSAYAGVPVIVNFWASWCNPCRKEFPLLQAARRAYADAGLEVIGVSYEDIASDARAFAEAQDANWPLARDPGGALAAAYGVRAIPQTFFIDADGTIVSRVFGITSARDLEAEIRKIVITRRH